MKLSKRKKVRDGLRVKTNEAEYPDQKPAKPFSDLIWRAIERVDVSRDLKVGERPATIDKDCFRVTILAIGVVISFVRAPAMKPTLSSSKTGRSFAEFLRD